MISDRVFEMTDVVELIARSRLRPATGAGQLELARGKLVRFA